MHRIARVRTVAEPTESIRELTGSLAAHREAIHRYVLGIVRDPPTAEDLTQEALLRAQRKLTTLEDPASLLPWLYRIATNLCRDRFRSPAHRHPPEPLGAEGGDGPVGRPVADPGPRLDKVFEQKEMSTCVQAYLAELSDSYRAVILLHDIEGLTNPEIASMLGVSVGTVKIRLHRARRKLGDALREACSFSTDERGVVVCERKPPDGGG